MKIAIVTGATKGMGREFLRELDKHLNDAEEIWAIGRTASTADLPKTMCRIRRIDADLTDETGITYLKKLLEDVHPKVKCLVNSAGFGKVGSFSDLDINVQKDMIRLNDDALMEVTYEVLPYMLDGGYIINLASSAAFLPQQNFAVYAATKAFVLSFSRALMHELKERHISVTAVCPGPVETEFFKVAESEGKSFKLKKYVMAKPDKVVKKAVLDALSRKERSIYSLPMQMFDILCKVFPHKIILDIYERLI